MAGVPRSSRGGLLTATASLTDTQIRGLAATPVTIIPAPAASEGFVLLGATLAFHVPVAYTTAVDMYLAASGVADLSGGDYFAAFSPATALAYGGVDTVMQASGLRAEGPIAGLPMILRAVGTITDGGAANTLTVTVTYTVIAV